MKTNLFKSLLVATMAIGAMGGVNAATGDVKTNFDIDFSNAISENKVNGTVGSLNITQNGTYPTEISNGILLLGRGTHNVIIPESERANDKDIVTTSFDLAFGKLIDKDFYFYFEDGDGNKIGNFELCAYWARLTNDFGIEVGDVFLPKNVANWNKRATFTITYDYAKKSITTTVLNHDGNKTATHTVAMNSTKPIAKFCIGSNYNNKDRRCQFDNLKITTTEGNYSNKTISIKYTTEDGLDIPNENIPENTVFTYSEAANTEFTPTYPSAFSTDDYIYTYVSGGDAFTVTEDKTVTLVYKKDNREKVNIVLNCIDENGETLELQTVATNYPIDKSFTYGINKYIIKDGNLYQANTLGTAYYAGSVNATATPIDIKYKKVNTTGTPIYFADFGDKPNTNTKSTEYLRASGGETAASNSKIVLVPANVLAPGYYDFEIAHYKNRAPKFNVGDKEYGVCSTASNSGLMVTTKFKNVLVINGEEISVTPGGSSYTDNMDYVLVTKTGDATETVSVSAAGYATYATKNNVKVPEDENVEVMTVTVNDDKTSITLNKIDAGTVIPANTGILVKAAQGNHDFVVTSDEGTKLENNSLVAATEPVTSDGAGYFALTQQSDGKVGFAVVANKVVIPAGKAYLSVPAAPNAKFFGLDGEATGINSVKTAKADGAYYTLEGVKTTKPVKGIYIHNGKKIVVK